VTVLQNARGDKKILIYAKRKDPTDAIVKPTVVDGNRSRPKVSSRKNT
jgi:hypothetical protein